VIQSMKFPQELKRTRFIYKIFKVVEHVEVPGGWCSKRGHGSSVPSPIPCPLHPPVYSSVSF
jgi:hypothetical protein